MKKIIGVLIGMLVLVLPTFGQIKIGPEIGLNFSNYTIKVATSGSTSNKVDTRANHGIRFGGIADIGLVRNISFQTELLYVRNGYTYGSAGWTVNTMQLPMSFLFKWNTYHKNKAFVGIGPYLAFNINGNNNYYNPATPLKLGSVDGTDNLKVVDLGYSLSLGYIVKGRLLLQGHYQRSFFNLEPTRSTESGIWSLNYGVTIGYLFRVI